MSGRSSREGRGRLRDRRREREALDRLLEAARAGRNGALVVRGEPGIGKTALLEYAVESASDFRVVRAAGVESEMELAFAALHRLCAPMLDRLDRLPTPQRDALAAAFGLRANGPPDRFLVGLAVLGLLSEAAEERPAGPPGAAARADAGGAGRRLRPAQDVPAVRPHRGVLPAPGPAPAGRDPTAAAARGR